VVRSSFFTDSAFRIRVPRTFPLCKRHEHCHPNPRRRPGRHPGHHGFTICDLRFTIGRPNWTKPARATPRNRLDYFVVQLRFLGSTKPSPPRLASRTNALKCSLLRITHHVSRITHLSFFVCFEYFVVPLPLPDQVAASETLAVHPSPGLRCNGARLSQPQQATPIDQAPALLPCPPSRSGCCE